MIGDPDSLRSRALPVRTLATLAVIATLTTAFAAIAQTAPVSYPPSRSMADVTAWIRSDTPLSPSQVVDVGVSAVTAVTASTPIGEPRGFLATVSSESLDPGIEGAQGIVSWSVPVQVDCEARKVKLGAMTGYPRRDLAKDGRPVRPADTDFISPTPGAPIDTVVRGLCDRDFRRPLLPGRIVAKAPEPAKPGPRQVIVASANPAGADPQPTKAARTAARPAQAISGPAPQSGSSLVAVQVGASPDPADAKGLLARVQRRFPEDLRGRAGNVAIAQVDGRTVHRALITGFASTGEAIALCERLKAGGQACFVRR
ncbi:SPOR domain-containing protein [Phenylobacterium sp.]|uniref:SPOR domain-containing protein n=1 Tax=Phenylobacterium sp. TaxID=1871053 RepID=UPI00286C037B|nr:SPOR domain-containing protein [Phenylobacterium sp.]